MTLAEKQQKFSLLVARLILWTYGHDYKVTLGEAYRTPEQAAWNARHGSGIKNSLHTEKLAIDLNLFIKNKITGVYEYKDDTESYKLLGDYWKTLDPDCCWGGDFKGRKDGNHFSLTHNGIK